MVLLGTRPEVIKLFPVIEELRKNHWDVILVNTGQQAALSVQYLEEFGISADYTLDVSSSGYELNQVFSEVMSQLGELIRQLGPSCLFVQGDTTTVAASALASFYAQVPCFHVEAGLRTHDKYSPFPEEGNRTLVANLASLHFAPTELAFSNLVKQGISQDEIIVTGNTGIDTLRSEISRASLNQSESARGQLKTIYASVHRREHSDEELTQILEGIRDFANDNPGWKIMFQVHTNPRIQGFVGRHLSDCRNVILVDPLNYHEIVGLLRTCSFILTDSGGLQEEAFAVGCPLIILRKSTERPEVLESEHTWLCVSGFADLKMKISEYSQRYANIEYRTDILNKSLGDGFASERIVGASRQFLGRKR